MVDIVGAIADDDDDDEGNSLTLLISIDILLTGRRGS